MDEAAGIVEIVAIDRHARAPGLLEMDHQLADGHVHVHRLDIGARHHDVLDAHFAETEDVVQHRPLIGRKSVADIGIRHQRVGEILAELFALRWPKQAHGPRPEGIVGFWVMFGPRRTTALVRRGRVRTVLALSGDIARIIVHCSKLH
ncbi:hypothetical protein D3C80_1214650 [compost metagenome]